MRWCCGDDMLGKKKIKKRQIQKKLEVRQYGSDRWWGRIYRDDDIFGGGFFYFIFLFSNRIDRFRRTQDIRYERKENLFE